MTINYTCKYDCGSILDYFYSLLWIHLIVITRIISKDKKEEMRNLKPLVFRI